MRPFEEDDDDFELNYLLDRHLQVAMAQVDEFYRLEVPKQSVDTLAEKQIPPVLPHTKISAKHPQHPPKLFAFFSFEDENDGKDVKVVEMFEMVEGTAAKNSKREAKRILQF